MTRYSPERPGLLMVSGCIPDVAGSRRRRRAWRLLEAAAPHYAVTLLVRIDGPMHIHQWRRLRGLCSGLTVCSTGASMREAATDAGGGRPSAAIASCPELWPAIADVPAPRVVDFAGGEPSRSLPVIGPVRAARLLRRDCLVAAACDAVTVATREDRRRFDDVADRIHLVSDGDADAWLDLLDRLTVQPRIARIGDAPRRAAA